MNSPFATEAIKKATTGFKTKEPDFLEAKDNSKLAYYAFVPKNIKAVIVFYHAAGAWGMPLYQLMAQETCKRYNMAVYLVDIRGHGNSAEPRGDAPTVESVWNDIDIAMIFVKSKHPNHFVFLAGHSSGAGLILNYIARHRAKEAGAEADGYIFLAPFLGSDSGTQLKHKTRTQKLVPNVKFMTFFMYAFTGGLLCAHKPALFFNYGDLGKTDTYILPSYTCVMSNAIFPRNAKKILQDIDKPCAIFVGQDDEQFDPYQILAYQKHFENRVSIARIISKATHLSIILKAPDLFEEAWQSFLHDTDDVNS